MRWEVWSFEGSDSRGGEGDWRLSYVMWSMIQSTSLCNETPLKTLNIKLDGSSVVWQEGDTLWFYGGTESGALCFGPSQISPCMCLHLAGPDCVLYNRTIIINVEISRVLWVSPGNYPTWKVVEIPEFVDSLRVLELGAGVWNEVNLWRILPFTFELWPSSRR